ncbi:SpoIIE family protein phosphatase [Actinomadura keratinilytica]|uniref:SpoIIE family protein phosphatase n=1 Tax=Actinomadura keratinilytica TaxID=547461 RepID=A0ABP7ZC17_9ACTN
MAPTAFQRGVRVVIARDQLGASGAHGGEPPAPRPNTPPSNTPLSDTPLSDTPLSDTPSMTARPLDAPRPGAPPLLDRHLLGVARLALVALDVHGRVTHWSRVAAELFGVDRRRAVGRPLTCLLRLPREHRGVFEPGAFAHVWCGTFQVPRVDDGEIAEIAWWVYPLRTDSPEGVRLVAMAADMRRLREEGPGVSVGDTSAAANDEELPRPMSGVRLVWVEPSLVPTGGEDPAGLGRRLATLLRPSDAAAAERIAARVLAMGHPAVNLSVTVRLPIVPYRASVPGDLQFRPHTAVPGAAEPQPPGRTRVPVPIARPRQGEEAMAVWDRLAFLGEAGEHIGSSLDHLQACRALAEVLVPRLADFAAVELLERVASDDEPPGRVDEHTLMRRVAVVHDDAERWIDTVPQGQALRHPRGTPFVEVMRTGRPVHIRRVTRRQAERICAAFAARDLGPLLAGRALLVVPLIARGQVLGTCTLLRRPDRPDFERLDLALIDELARGAALCVDNGRLYRREVRQVRELQRAMLPADPPRTAGARVCFRYLPAGQAAQVGGDWFDAIPLPGCRLGIVIGDVMGHGVTSAAVMGQLRTAVRTLAGQDLRPDGLLRELDGLARRLGDDCLATCLYAVYDPVARRCQLANAGHLPPVLVSPDGGGTVLRLPPGLPIGVGCGPFETVEVGVPDGARLVLCTDGLLERRDRDIERGLAELCGRLAGSPRTLDATCDAALGMLDGPAPADDVALVAVGLDGIPAEHVASWTLDPEPSMVGRARALAASRLAEWGLADAADTVQLLVSELVTNALVHGAGAVGMRLIKCDSLLCEVSDDGRELPRLCRTDPTAESGRGLQLVAHLAQRWGTRRGDLGKIVWFEHPL